MKVDLSGFVNKDAGGENRAMKVPFSYQLRHVIDSALEAIDFIGKGLFALDANERRLLEDDAPIDITALMGLARNSLLHASVTIEMVENYINKHATEQQRKAILFALFLSSNLSLEAHQQRLEEMKRKDAINEENATLFAEIEERIRQAREKSKETYDFMKRSGIVNTPTNRS